MKRIKHIGVGSFAAFSGWSGALAGLIGGAVYGFALISQGAFSSGILMISVGSLVVGVGVGVASLGVGLIQGVMLNIALYLSGGLQVDMDMKNIEKIVKVLRKQQLMHDALLGDLFPDHLEALRQEEGEDGSSFGEQ